MFLSPSVGLPWVHQRDPRAPVLLHRGVTPEFPVFPAKGVRWGKWQHQIHSVYGSGNMFPHNEKKEVSHLLWCSVYFFGCLNYVLAWVEQALCTPCINCWVTCHVVPISKGDERLQVTSHQATYEKGQPESRSCQIHPKKLSWKYLPIRNRTQMDYQLIIKVPFSQKWISLNKCIFYIASDLAENVPSYFIIGIY